MSFLRIYEILATEDRRTQMRDTLADLADAVRAIDGCQSVEILEDSDLPDRYLFIERWADREAWSAGNPPKAVFQRLLAEAAGPPVMIGAFLSA